MGDRIGFLKAKGHLKWPDRVQAVADLRNKLAHEVNFFSNFDDWNSTLFTVKRELEHLGVVANLEPPPELLHQREQEEETRDE
ncbi:MAG: hypothetical protein PVSMB1_06840 [Gemmatimonadaceae bacterium]